MINNILAPAGGTKHTRPKFLTKNQILGGTKVNSLVFMKGSVEDLGVANHKGREPVGIAPMFESALNHEDGALFLPSPFEADKLLTVQMSGHQTVFQGDGSTVLTTSIAIGEAKNDPTHLMISREVHPIKLMGLDDTHVIRQTKTAIVITDTVVQLLLLINGKVGTGPRDTFHVFYSLTYDLDSGEFVTPPNGEEPIHALGLDGYPDLNRYLTTNNPGPSFSPFWNKDKEEWVFLVHSPEYSQTASVVSYSPSDAELVTHITGNLGTMKACVTPDYRAFYRDGGLSTTGLGSRLTYPINILDTPGGVGGLGNLSRSGWSTITVLTTDFKYFISLDENTDKVTDGVTHELNYGACDYDEEVTFRKTLASLHGL